MITEEIIQTTRNLISEHFSDITFIEEGHKYFIGTEEYTPVSNIIENFVRPSINIQSQNDMQKRMEELKKTSSENGNIKM